MTTTGSRIRGPKAFSKRYIFEVVFPRMNFTNNDNDGSKMLEKLSFDCKKTVELNGAVVRIGW